MGKNETKKSALAAMAGLNEKDPELPREFIGSTGLGECSVNIPQNITLDNSIDEILGFARQQDISDVHLCADNPVICRKYSKLTPATKDILTAEAVEQKVSAMLTENQMAEFLECGDFEFVYTIEGAGRYRVTLMKQRHGWDLTARLIPTEIRTFEDSGMPESCAGLTKWAQGLVLVTGPAGCGKTSSLSTLVDMVNADRPDHIITIENPIEVVYTPKKCQITQREVNVHTLSQTNALRAALREDPDILVVSELRDFESVQLALTAAETGHLVFGTMNTNDAAQTVSSLIDSFPPEDQSIITNMISESLRGVISQQLIPKKDGTGIVPAFEVLIVNTAIANMIRERKIEQMTNAMATGKSDGMVLLDNSLNTLVQNDIIDGLEAYNRAINPSTFSQYA